MCRGQVCTQLPIPWRSTLKHGRQQSHTSALGLHIFTCFTSCTSSVPEQERLAAPVWTPQVPQPTQPSSVHSLTQTALGGALGIGVHTAVVWASTWEDQKVAFHQ